jgi:LuxR family maltose regulon positive regulatory protein
MDAVREAEQLPLDYQTVSRFGGRPAACRALLKMIQAVSSKDVHRFDARHLEAVEKWAEGRGLGANMPRMSVVRIDSMNDEFEYLIGVRLLIAQNKPDRALQVLGCLERAAEDGGRTGRVIEILILAALARGARGDTGCALAILERALSLAEPEGYVRLFVDEGAPMAELLSQAASRGIAPDYVDKLLAAMDLGTVPKQLASVPLLLEPLSDRELDVLRLLNTDLSGPEIAAELVVSVNTVRTHIRRIYSKLDVHSRYEAVVRANELDLL